MVVHEEYGPTHEAIVPQAHQPPVRGDPEISCGSGTALRTVAPAGPTIDRMSHHRVPRSLAGVALVVLAAGGCGGGEPPAREPARGERAPAAGGAPAGTATASAVAAPPGTLLRDVRGGELTVGPGCGGVPPALRGTWRYELRPEEIPPEFADARVGTMEMRLGRGNLGDSRLGGGAFKPLDVCVTGAELHRAAFYECPGAGNEVLRWAVDGDELRLTPIRSKCFITSIHFGDPWRTRRLRRVSDREPSSPPAPRAAVPRPLEGVWESDIPRQDLPPEASGMQTGRHVLRLGPGNEARMVGPSGDVLTSGAVRIRGDRIRFAGEPSGGACQDRGPALYRYRAGGDTLRLQRLGDACVDRAHALTHRPWTRTR